MTQIVYQDALSYHEGTHIFQLYRNWIESGLSDFRIFLRFRKAINHHCWIDLELNNDEPELDVDLESGSILGYYCTCQSGFITLGYCTHISNNMWLFGLDLLSESHSVPTNIVLFTTLNINIIFDV